MEPTINIANATKDDLVQTWQQKREWRNESIRQAVLREKRLDVLVKLVFEKPEMVVKPFHYELAQFQAAHDRGLMLVYRGAGKTQLLTIGKGVLELLCDPDIRILLGSRTCGQSESFLRGIKKRLQGAQLIEIFGNQYNPDKWDSREINVAGRTTSAMESNVTTVGIDGAVVSKHFDMIICDDLVGMDNSRTHLQREKTKQWYYTELEPTLEEGGKMWVIGTRYHFNDLYGHLLGSEFKDANIIIKALDDEGCSPWPERHPVEWFEKKRKESGTIVFNCQYQCDTEAMKGHVFKDEYFKYYDQLPENLLIYQGVDVAIGQSQFNDYFVIVTIGVDKATDDIYVIDYLRARATFTEQVLHVYNKFMEYDPIRVGIESNAYQKALYTELKMDKKYNKVRAFPIYTSLDKLTRLTKMAARFENGDVYIGKDMPELIEELLMFPSGEHDDVADGLDFAILSSQVRSIKRRETEPGLI
jgi:predicted phage terminase large subunit-like protein